jgi:cell division protein FtsI/penicillin-binding protein 2
MNPSTTSSTESTRFRLGVLAIVIVGLFAALFARLWFLQVMTSESYSVEAEANRVRVVQVEAPRGRILDTNGKVLVDNRVSTVVTVDRVVFTELNNRGDRDDVLFLDNGAGGGTADNGIQDGNEPGARGEAA